MPSGKSKTAPRIKGLNEVGRYAVGVQWLDGHDSIFPLETLRRRCPCNECAGELEGALAPERQRLMRLSRLGEKGLFLQWADGHESLYVVDRLRELCRCAYCVGEPEKPITG
ncbi:MAG: gamma-butyrobetaine hydroxylase-like domain-containing protein [Candidatus Binataceae bacterium]